MTLVEDHELATFKVTGIGDGDAQAGRWQWYHLPIADVSVPTAAFEAEWAKVGEQLRARLRSGVQGISSTARAGSAAPALSQPAC